MLKNIKISIFPEYFTGPSCLLLKNEGFELFISKEKAFNDW